MNSDIEIEYAKNSNEIMEFIHKNWSKDHILSKNQDLFNWQYYGNNSLNFIVARCNNDLIGVLGFIPNSNRCKC